MKKICLTILILMICYTNTLEYSISVRLKPSDVKMKEKADFNKAFNIIKKFEGYYADLPHDPGKETYVGITRRYNPKWDGWKVIDKHKLDSGFIKHNQRIYNADPYVEKYYKNVWDKENYNEIFDQDKANYLFDFRNSGQISILITKSLLNDFGHNLPINSDITTEYIEAINNSPKVLFIEKLKERRIWYYCNVVKKYPKQQKYLNVWLYRARNAIQK